MIIENGGITIPKWLADIIELPNTQVSVNFNVSVSEGDTVVVPPDDDVVVPPQPKTVIANNVGHTYTNMFHDRNKNTEGFPIWRIQEPRIQYENGWEIKIWPTRIWGNGEQYAYAVASGIGMGFFVLEADIK